MDKFNQTVFLLLNEIKQEMMLRKLWQTLPPEPDAFISEQPFAVDKMSSYEWLQWIFLPRMQALIDANSVLPRNFALHPYFEEATKQQEEALQLLSLLKRLDLLVKE